MESKSLEFNWQPSASQGADLSIFMHVLDVFRYGTAVNGLDVRLDLAQIPIACRVTFVSDAF